LKIAQVNSYYYPFMIGGAEWYVRNISRELSKAGNDVTVFTASEWGKQKAAADEVFEGVKIRRLPLKLDLTYRYIPTIMRNSTALTPSARRRRGASAQPSRSSTSIQPSLGRGTRGSP
jgi:glycosyltransferase involved in cell wall biosynthesis